MKKKRYLLAKELAGTAPSEILVFRAGTNPSYSGPIVFDAEAAAAVMAAFEERGIRLHFDYAHARPHALESANPDPQYQKAAGWFDLEVRDSESGPELWAVRITWTPAAKKAIEDLEWGYFSPWCDVEVATGRVVEIRNIALTNDPAMLGIAPVAAIADRRLEAGLSFDVIVRAIDRALRVRMPEEYPWVEAVYDDSVVYEVSGKLYRRGYVLEGQEARLADDAHEVVRTYAPLTQPLAAARPLDQRSFRAPSATEDSAKAEKGSSLMERTALILALGLKSDATDAEVTAALNAKLGVIQTLMTLTNTQTLDRAVSDVSVALQTTHRVLAVTKAETPSEAIGKLEGWSEAAKKLEESQAKIVELEKGAREARVNDLITKGISEKKVTVAMEANLRAIGIDDPDRLKGLIDTLPVVLASKPSNIDESAAAATASGKKWEELSHTQRVALKRTNPELAKALKAEHLARTSV